MWKKESAAKFYDKDHRRIAIDRNKLKIDAVVARSVPRRPTSALRRELCPDP
jgi:hypothetical protein